MNITERILRMKEKIDKFDEFSKIYSFFTEKNKTSIFEAAQNLLEEQLCNSCFDDNRKSSALSSPLESERQRGAG
jgi:hypothetical protein